MSPVYDEAMTDTRITAISPGSVFLDEAALLACQAHASLAQRFGWIPERTPEDFLPRIDWMTREGEVFGMEDNGHLSGFTGYFIIDDFRNAGPGAYTPDWCTAFSGTLSPSRRETCRQDLIRHLLDRCRGKGVHIHGISTLSHETELAHQLSLWGYGTIVLDAAQPLTVLQKNRSMNPSGGSIQLRRAAPGDAETLAALNDLLALHIGNAPVLMPDPQGMSADEWEQWLKQPDTAACLAFDNSLAVGFIKAEEPQFDVTFTVHDTGTLAINGMFVLPGYRRRGTASSLLSWICDEAETRGKTLVSVDCETTNPEAFSFWRRYFEPLSWSFERRF